ncbi:MAG: hypothetical protein K1Y01_14650 [Vicinamibacteria bacterium]|nr:hypothetical protein [Vicinamibacteria bacterium]
MIGLDPALVSIVDPVACSEFSTMRDRAEAAKVLTSYVTDHSVVAAIPFKARGMFQIGLRRSIEISDGFAASFNAGLYTPLFILARASIETGCLMWDLWTRLARILIEQDKAALEDFDDRIIRAILGRKVGPNDAPPEYVAPNVLTIIQRQTKDLEGLAQLYAELSEIAHPNNDGMLSVYASARHEGHDFIDRPFASAPLGLSAAVHAATVGLKQSVFAAEQFETIGKDFAAFCEAAIYEKGNWPPSIPYPAQR